jgi:hypothetical protein
MRCVWKQSQFHSNQSTILHLQLPNNFEKKVNFIKLEGIYLPGVNQIWYILPKEIPSIQRGSVDRTRDTEKKVRFTGKFACKSPIGIAGVVFEAWIRC